jgi:RNA polymerase sigma-70 factor (ECF subfamily)
MIPARRNNRDTLVKWLHLSLPGKRGLTRTLASGTHCAGGGFTCTGTGSTHIRRLHRLIWDLSHGNTRMLSETGMAGCYRFKAWSRTASAHWVYLSEARSEMQTQVDSESTEVEVRLGGMTDPELVMLARGGRREAFDALVERYRHRCVSVAYLYTNNHADAEDQTQNAFLNAYRFLAQCDPDHFRPWLDKIVQNQCLMFQREGQRRPLPLFTGHRVNHIRSREMSPEDRIDRASLRRLIRREVLKLPKDWRSVLWLRRIEEWHITEVAKVLGIGVLAAKSRLHWAQLGLRARLKRIGLH